MAISDNPICARSCGFALTAEQRAGVFPISSRISLNCLSGTLSGGCGLQTRRSYEWRLLVTSLSKWTALHSLRRVNAFPRKVSPLGMRCCWLKDCIPTSFYLVCARCTTWMASTLTNNYDSSAGAIDCLKLPDCVFVPFVEGDTFEIKARKPVCQDRVEKQGTVLQTDGSLKADLVQIHTSLCHAGHTRISLSNVLYKGVKVQRAGVDAHMYCRGCGCRLGGARRPPYYTGKITQPHSSIKMHVHITTLRHSWPASGY